MGKLNIVYTTDENYVPMCGVSLTSLFENNKEAEQIHVYILGKNLSKDSVNRLSNTAKKYERELTFIDNEIAMPVVLSYLKKYSQYKDPNSYSELVYIYSFRLILGDILPSSVERVIYIGSDTLVVGKLDNVFCMEMGDKVIAAAYDTMNCYYKTFIGLEENSKYYNDDVLIFDLEKWRRQKLADRVFEQVAKNIEKYRFPVQDAINASIENQIALLPINFNFMTVNFYYRCNAIKGMYGIKEYYSKKEYKLGKQNVSLCHFSGQAGGRPWFKNSNHPMKKSYDVYYYMSEWKDIPQKERKLELQYKIQLWGYYHLPKFIAEFIGVLMQKYFGISRFVNKK